MHALTVTALIWLVYKVHWRTAARVELKLQKESRLAKLGHYEPNYSKVFRRSTDQISPEARQRLARLSKL